MILAEKIMMLRKQNSWSQEELAEKLDVSRQSVSKWESGASIPDLDKIIKLSGIFSVSTDYLLKDELEDITFSETEDTYDDKKVRNVSIEEANAFMNIIRKISKRIALSVSLCIISPIALIFLGGLAEHGSTTITEDMAGGIGTVILLLVVASGVAALIMSGMQLSKYEYLEKEKISLQYGVYGIVEKKKEAYEETYRRSIAAGVVLCIVGVVPLLLATAVGAGELIYVICIDVLLMMIASGVYLLIRSGIIYGSYEKLVQEGDYTEEKKEIEKRTSFFPGVYWCIVTAIYLVISFYYGRWDVSWIIWPVAGVLFAGIYGIFNAVMKSKE